MRITTLYDPGTAEIKEDGHFMRLPFIGVADGISGIYHPNDEPMEFAGRSGGQMAVDYLVEALFQGPIEAELEQMIKLANEKVRKLNNHHGIKIQESDRLAGAVFAIAKIKQSMIHIVQTGDCFALWIDKNEAITITRNQFFPYEVKHLRKIKELMEKHGGDRNKMWREFMPFLAKSRKEHVNEDYGVLNGQSALFDHCQQFAITIPQLLILGTDGLIPCPNSRMELSLDKEIVSLYRQGGLKAILQAAREKEEKKKYESHVDHVEATGIAIEF
jgi:serine/threonine protein phosphatase PrpC